MGVWLSMHRGADRGGLIDLRSMISGFPIGLGKYSTVLPTLLRLHRAVLGDFQSLVVSCDGMQVVWKSRILVKTNRRSA
jgi:hypothetical protein